MNTIGVKSIEMAIFFTRMIKNNSKFSYSFQKEKLLQPRARIWSFVNELFGTLSAKAKDVDSEVKEVKATLEFLINVFVL